MMRRLAATTIGLLAGACNHCPDPQDYYIDSAMPAHQQDLVRAAAEDWNQVSTEKIGMPVLSYRGNHICDTQVVMVCWSAWTDCEDPSRADRTIINTAGCEQPPDFSLGQAHITISQDFGLEEDPWMIDVSAHEFGHLLGLKHIATPAAIMSPGVKATTVATDADRHEFCRVWGC